MSLRQKVEVLLPVPQSYSHQSDSDIPGYRLPFVKEMACARSASGIFQILTAMKRLASLARNTQVITSST